jgi:hypothetical protein
MEMLILIAVIATGTSALYVAYTFKKYAERDADPLIQRTLQAARTQTGAASEDLRRQIQANTTRLDAMARNAPVTTGELEQQVQAVTAALQRELQSITTELRQDREAAAQLANRIDTRQAQLAKDLSEANRRVAQLGESLARQAAQLTAIYSQGRLTGPSAEMNQLTLAMLEAESHVDSKGWGTLPHLFALTEWMPAGLADHELSAGTPDALILVPHKLPDGDLAAALASIHWPEDVVGCVLVTELTDLPARKDGAPVDQVAARHWASARPDGGPARLAVSVGRNGEHVCGFRVKGEHDVQTRADIGSDVVNVLRGTF